MTTEALQSQLFILKILSVCMGSRWNHRHEQEDTRFPSRASKTQNGSAAPGHVESPLPSSGTHQNKKFRQASSEFSSSTPPPWTDLCPLDDNCARYILCVMVLYLRQTAPPEARLMSSSNLAPDASLHDFESVDLPTESSAFDDYSSKIGPSLPPHISQGSKPVLKLKNSSASFHSAGSTTSSHWQLGRTFQFEKTHMALVNSTLALNLLISKFAGRIVYHLSASNWAVVFHRIRQKIHFLASIAEDNPDTIDLQLMTHSAMDRTRLVQVLHELSSLLVNMKRQAQAAVAIPLRMAIWNWIEMCPLEYNEAVRSRGKLEGAPERVFDLLHSAIEPGRERALWPTLTILACLAAERLSPDYQIDVETRSVNFASHKSSHRKVRVMISEVYFDLTFFTHRIYDLSKS
jgi:hypothetical protein